MQHKKFVSLFIAILHIFSVSLPSNAFAGQFSVFQKTYVRDTGTPNTVSDTFDVLNPNTTWILRAINGSLEDNEVNKVSSSTLYLNGQEVLQPNQFNQNVNLIESAVNVLSSNKPEGQSSTGMPVGE